MTNRSNITPGNSRYPTDLLSGIMDSGLMDTAEKILSNQRLEFEDGLALLKSNDLLGVGVLARHVRTQRHGDKAFFIANHHLNYTNICINACRFCAFQRPKGHKDGYILSPDQAARRIASAQMDNLREVHLGGAINPELGLDYYVEMLEKLTAARPDIKLKAFTAVEIDNIATQAGLSIRQTLERLKQAGLQAMPGGGAEVFSDRVRERLFPNKIDHRRWLDIHGQAHALGIGTNATLLFGHIETLEERVDHFIKLRNQQDKSGGFRAFISLAFHPANTEIGKLPGPTGVDILKTIATARLMLDNFEHIKAYWIMLGVKLAQVALSFGADDLEGTIIREEITHEAGAETAKGMSRNDLIELIKEAGFRPFERDTFHHEVEAA